MQNCFLFFNKSILLNIHEVRDVYQFNWEKKLWEIIQAVLILMSCWLGLPIFLFQDPKRKNKSHYDTRIVHDIIVTCSMGLFFCFAKTDNREYYYSSKHQTELSSLDKGSKIHTEGDSIHILHPSALTHYCDLLYMWL